MPDSWCFVATPLVVSVWSFPTFLMPIFLHTLFFFVSIERNITEKVNFAFDANVNKLGGNCYQSVIWHSFSLGRSFSSTIGVSRRRSRSRRKLSCLRSPIARETLSAAQLQACSTYLTESMSFTSQLWCYWQTGKFTMSVFCRHFESKVVWNL